MSMSYGRAAATQPRAGYQEDTLLMPRSRGMGSGVLLIVLGIWGAIIPLVGPLFDYRVDAAGSWTFTGDRWWLSILPGAAVVIGGLIMLGTADLLIANAGIWLAIAGGIWFIIGPSVSLLWGSPVAVDGIGSGGDVRRFLEQIGYFYGLGVAVIIVALGVWGRLTLARERDRQPPASAPDAVGIAAAPPPTTPVGGFGDTVVEVPDPGPEAEPRPLPDQ